MTKWPDPPNLPDMPGAGERQRKAAALQAQFEALRRKAPFFGEPSAPGAKPAEPAGCGPIGQGEYVVRKGECLSSIARDQGHFWKTIWNDPANAQLREVRKDPNILLPGDRVSIPPLKTKVESGQTEIRHRFVRKGEPAHLRMRILIEDEPVRDARYTLTIDGREHAGVTDGDGWVQAPIPGNARTGELVVEGPGRRLTFPLELGGVPPITEISGVQARLSNLGYLVAAAGGVLTAATKAAIQRFQAASGHPHPTGELDDQTRALLRERHGS